MFQRFPPQYSPLCSPTLFIEEQVEWGISERRAALDLLLGLGHILTENEKKKKKKKMMIEKIRLWGFVPRSDF